MSDTNHSANCSCGQLRIAAQGDPDSVIACNCLSCQQRTGAPFSVSGYYTRDRIASTEGEAGLFERKADSGRTVSTSSCPKCGSSVFWELEMRPDYIGIATGCFAEPDYMTPTRVIWAENSHPWIEFPGAMPVFAKATPET
jgi:hypothetical protein